MQFINKPQFKKAVAYYRHSAEDKQENSVPIQREHAQKFAEKYNIEIIHEEADEGETGLLADRRGFEQLLNQWVLNPDAPHFDYVLVYDVTRWGRFQQTDESGYYQFQCERVGKKVIYIKNGFPKEGEEFISSLQISIERYMAADYSRQLSDKVWHGSMRVSKEGFSAGGVACYGLARLLLDENKKPIRILNRGEHKMISNQRVIFTPLNDVTTQTVKDIFNMFVNDWYSLDNIVEVLNEKGILSANGHMWNNGKILRILRNEVYTGMIIYNKTSKKLRSKTVKNPRNEWATAVDVFEGLIDKDLYRRAQERLFWTTPSKWKKGVYMIEKTKKFVEQEIKDLFIKQGINEDKAEFKIKNFPLAYSVSFVDGDPLRKYTVFVIEEQARNYEKVLAISVSLDKKELIDNVFLIPTSDFNQCNFCLFSEQDKCHSDYMIKSDKIYESVMPFVDKLTTSSKIYENISK